MEREQLSKRQEDILSVIAHYAALNGYPPTFREVADLVGLQSSSTIHGHLERLKKKGLLDWEESKPRTLRIL
ncbi:transcriptional regulator [Paenibacillus filicis]|uniref:Transcriptional regulator n=1 Tax=Paenibacillus filicis TaxID=669464 RepID=A0ABU9DID9_9BACL